MNSTDVQNAAGAATTKAKGFLNQQVDQRSTDIGKAISQTAGDLRQIATHLRESSATGGAGTLADSAADFVDRIGRYLQDADGNQLMHDLESYSRERPWVIATGALFTGFAASRVLKSASARRYYASDVSSGSNSPYGVTARDASYAGSVSGETSYGTSGAGAASPYGRS